MKKKLLSIALVSIFAVSALTAQTQLDDFNAALTGFLGEVNEALPDNAVVGGTWSDAYIGQIVGIPPHFGVGIAAGVSRFPLSSLKEAVRLTGAELPVDELVLPNFAVEGRIGGFILPFDIGFRGGMLPEMKFDGIGISYLNFGADIRYSLLKDTLVMPGVSIGLGYYHTSGAISYTFNPAELVAVSYPGVTVGAVADEELKIDFATNVIDVKAQISKNLIFITPYAGFGASMAMTESTYKLVNQTKTLSTKDEPTFGLRVYGGTSINLLVLKLDISGMYNVMSKNWGANLGFRLQL